MKHGGDEFIRQRNDEELWDRLLEDLSIEGLEDT
jgi:hypothetical protein